MLGSLKSFKNAKVKIQMFFHICGLISMKLNTHEYLYVCKMMSNVRATVFDKEIP